MTYQIQHMAVPSTPMSKIRNFTAQAVVILALYSSTNPENEVLCVPLSKQDFEDQQMHPAKTREEVLVLLPEKLSYSKDIYQNCLENNDCTTVRFEEDIMDWVPGPHPWAKSMAYAKAERTQKS